MNRAQDFIEYVRTLMFWRLRLKDEAERSPVFIPYNKVKQFIPTSTKTALAELVASGELEITRHTSPNGKEYNMYKALKAGYIVPHLLEPKGAPLTPLHLTMMRHLLHVELPNNYETSLYFKAFQLLKNDFLRLFFTVDVFCGRVHTPVSNLKTEARKQIRLYGNPTNSLDVRQMQPTILAKILERNLGENELSTWVNAGLDVYEMLQAKAGLANRKEAKKRFFEILFNKPSNDLATLFGNVDWVHWINEYKSQPVKGNPHGQLKPHSNLAWLLQNTEVQIMQKVWEKLTNRNIPFLTVHDEIVIQQHHSTTASQLFSEVLSHEFKSFKISGSVPSTPAPKTIQKNEPILQPKITLFELQRQWYCQMLEAQFKDEPQPENTLKLGRCNSIAEANELMTKHYEKVDKEFTAYKQRLSQILFINPN